LDLIHLKNSPQSLVSKLQRLLKSRKWTQRLTLLILIYGWMVGMWVFPMHVSTKWILSRNDLLVLNRLESLIQHKQPWTFTCESANLHGRSNELPPVHMIPRSICNTELRQMLTKDTSRIFASNEWVNKDTRCKCFMHPMIGQNIVSLVQLGMRNDGDISRLLMIPKHMTS